MDAEYLRYLLLKTVNSLTKSSDRFISKLSNVYILSWYTLASNVFTQNVEANHLQPCCHTSLALDYIL